MNCQNNYVKKTSLCGIALISLLFACIMALVIQLTHTSNFTANVPKVAEECMPSSVVFQIRKNIKVDPAVYGVDEQQVTEAATGFIWADEKDELLIVTNNHVVEGAESIRIRLSPEKAQGILLPAETLGRDETADIAVVSLKKSDIPKDIVSLVRPAKLGDVEKVQLGQTAILIGNALGEGQNVSCGVISAVNRRLDNGAFQQEVFVSDAAINFGNSGSMLLNGDGEVIGVNTSKATKDNSEGMGYYVPIDTVALVVENLLHQAGR